MSPIHHMCVIRYYRDGRPWESQTIMSPTWAEVESAVRRMDNWCFPVVQLNCHEDDDAEDLFNIVGGDGRWALFHMMGEWQYEDPEGGDEEVSLWESDQGYCCQEKHVLRDLEEVIRLTRLYFESGSYESLAQRP